MAAPPLLNTTYSLHHFVPHAPLLLSALEAATIEFELEEQLKLSGFSNTCCSLEGLSVCAQAVLVGTTSIDTYSRSLVFYERRSRKSLATLLLWPPAGLMLTRGSSTLINVAITWLVTRFDAQIHPATLSPILLTNLTLLLVEGSSATSLTSSRASGAVSTPSVYPAISFPIPPAPVSYTPKHTVEFAFSFPSFVSELDSLSITMPLPQFTELTRECVHEGVSVLRTLCAAVEGNLHVHANKLSLMRSASPFAAFSHQGRVKIFAAESYVLSILFRLLRDHVVSS
eukprot:TRINITY_DN523_c0_g2_i3.p1 TRINITY_DN523_c0_g2~~TRINITY_DN523_c0_g2_i3.p1  ORF type:complete len:329 (+),score=50.50 TRINITY_DN523_c0_g2_i3:134-988(+)